MTIVEGGDRVDVPYLWPPTLLLPPRPPKLIYLDLNHWIELSNAHAGRSDGGRALLDALIGLVNAGTAIFPISDTLYIEICKMANRQFRRELREVIEVLSRYAVVTSRSVIANHEIEAMLDKVVGPSTSPINAMPYLDWGIARAFGRVGGFRIHDAEDERDLTEQQRETWPDGPQAFDRLFAEAELLLNRHVLDGPSTDEEEAQLAQDGYDRTGHMDVAQKRADQESEQAERFNADPKWRRGRIRDVISAREVMIEDFDMLIRGVHARGAEIEDVYTSPEDARRAFDALPSFDVAVTLKTSYHRDGTRRWTVNDISDIDALASTVPYCDVVVTDKAIAAHANRTGLAERLDAIVTPGLSQAIEHLT